MRFDFGLLISAEFVGGSSWSTYYRSIRSSTETLSHPPTSVTYIPSIRAQRHETPITYVTPVANVQIPAMIRPTAYELFHLTRRFQIEGRINGKSFADYQINMGISHIWDRYSEDIRGNRVELHHAIKVEDSMGDDQWLTHYAPGQNVAIGDMQVNGVAVYISDRNYFPGQAHAFGQVGFGKRSPFAQPAVFLTSPRGKVSITFSSAEANSYCVDGTSLAPLPLIDGIFVDEWVVRGFVAVGDTINSLRSQEKSIRIESVYEYVELTEVMGANFLQYMVGYLGCRARQDSSLILFEDCTCTYLMASAPRITYDLSGRVKIAVLPKTYLESAANGSQCIAHVKIQKQAIQRGSDVLIVGGPFLQSTVTVIDTSDRKNPKLSVCQSKF